MRVLIADDDEDQLALRGMLLRNSGFETMEATNAGSALQLAAAEKPECAVIDLRLPTEAFGLQLIRELKRLDASMHILVLTGANPGRLAHFPERKLVDEIILKGSSSAYLIQRVKALGNASGLSRGSG